MLNAIIVIAGAFIMIYNFFEIRVWGGLYFDRTALYANAVGTSYVAELHSYLGMDEEAKGAWMQFREHVLEHADEYDGGELEKCLELISKRIAKLEN